MSLGSGTQVLRTRQSSKPERGANRKEGARANGTYNGHEGFVHAVSIHVLGIITGDATDHTASWIWDSLKQQIMLPTFFQSTHRIVAAGV
jgi:hypothetical protein